MVYIPLHHGDSVYPFSNPSGDFGQDHFFGEFLMLRPRMFLRYCIIRTGQYTEHIKNDFLLMQTHSCCFCS